MFQWQGDDNIGDASIAMLISFFVVFFDRMIDTEELLYVFMIVYHYVYESLDPLSEGDLGSVPLTQAVIFHWGELDFQNVWSCLDLSIVFSYVNLFYDIKLLLLLLSLFLDSIPTT